MDIGNLYVGNSGNGELSITGGAHVNIYGNPSSVRNDFGFYIGQNDNSSGVVLLDGIGSKCVNNGELYVGKLGNASFTITNGATATSNGKKSYIGYGDESTGVVTVDGIGSRWDNAGTLFIGNNSRLDISNGASVTNTNCSLASKYGETAVATVDGVGSSWNVLGNLSLGTYHNESLFGDGKLSINNHAVIFVDGVIGIYSLDSCINISDYGMLAIKGELDESLDIFLDRVIGVDNINFWDDDTSSWNNIANGILGEDYTLTYFDQGEYDGYTVLMVPEPTAILLFAVGCAVVRKRKS